MNVKLLEKLKSKLLLFQETQQQNNAKSVQKYFHNQIIYYNNFILVILIFFILISVFILLEDNEYSYTNISALTFVLLLTFNLVILIFAHNLAKHFFNYHTNGIKWN